MAPSPTPATPSFASGYQNRWAQLLCGLVCMIAISSPQYVWTLFTKPLTAKLVSLSALQITFSVLIVLQTFFSPFQGSLIDRFGTRRLISIGALLSGVSWMLASQADSLTALYLTYGLVGGLGTGIVYVGVVGHMVRWFPQRRGFAVFEAVAMTSWLTLRDHPAAFVVLSGVVFFGWGEIFSLFPSTLTDTFGTKHATANYGCLYMAQGVGAIFGGPLAALMREQLGSWMPVFGTAITLDVVAALLAIAALKPWRARFMRCIR